MQTNHPAQRVPRDRPVRGRRCGGPSSYFDGDERTVRQFRTINIIVWCTRLRSSLRSRRGALTWALEGTEVKGVVPYEIMRFQHKTNAYVGGSIIDPHDVIYDRRVTDSSAARIEVRRNSKPPVESRPTDRRSCPWRWRSTARRGWEANAFRYCSQALSARLPSVIWNQTPPAILGTRTLSFMFGSDNC